MCVLFVCVCVQVIRETIEENDGQFSVKMEVRGNTPQISSSLSLSNPAQGCHGYRR